MSIALLVALQRSGTGALGTVLYQHPKVGYLGEVFLDGQRDLPGNFNSFLLKLVAEEPEYALPTSAQKTFARHREHLESVGTKPIKVIDVKYNSMHHLSSIAYDHHFLALAKEARLPVMHLTRKNFLKAIVSLDLAEINNVWHSREAGALSIKTLSRDTAKLIGRLDASARQMAAIVEGLQGYDRWIEFDSENMFDGEGQLAPRVEAAICRLLEIEPFALKRPILAKQGNDDLSSMIENFNEVHEVLRDTPYLWMLGPQS